MRQSVFVALLWSLSFAYSQNLRRKENSSHFQKNRMMCQCFPPGHVIHDLFEDSVLELKTLDNSETPLNGFDDKCSNGCRDLVNSRHTHSHTLLVFTTCNHLDMSIHALQSLRSMSDSFDMVIVDDHSVDGTSDYLHKKV